MRTKIVFLAVILTSLAAMPARAQPQGDRSQLVALLEPTLEKCEWKVRTITGGPKGLMLLHQAKMRRILGELKAGQSVEPKDIDDIMKEHSP